MTARVLDLSASRPRPTVSRVRSRWPHLVTDGVVLIDGGKLAHRVDHWRIDGIAAAADALVARGRIMPRPTYTACGLYGTDRPAGDETPVCVKCFPGARV